MKGRKEVRVGMTKRKSITGMMITVEQVAIRKLLNLVIHVCLNARSTVNKRNELNIMVEDINPHIMGITEFWATTDISHAQLGMTGCVMFRKYRVGRRGGGVILYIKESTQAY